MFECRREYRRDAQPRSLTHACVAGPQELADVNPQFLHELHVQLAASSPLMARARGSGFAQLIHHKARTATLVVELEAACDAERAALEKSAAAVDAYAQKAEAMHRRLHNRSAAQCAEWLRSGVKKASDVGNKMAARHLLENETRRVKTALEAMAAWLDGSARERITALPARFDSLAKRALMHTTATQVPQVGSP